MFKIQSFSTFLPTLSTKDLSTYILVKLCDELLKVITSTKGSINVSLYFAEGIEEDHPNNIMISLKWIHFSETFSRKKLLQFLLKSFRKNKHRKVVCQKLFWYVIRYVWHIWIISHVWLKILKNIFLWYLHWLMPLCVILRTSG